MYTVRISIIFMILFWEEKDKWFYCHTNSNFNTNSYRLKFIYLSINEKEKGFHHHHLTIVKQRDDSSLSLGESESTCQKNKPKWEEYAPKMNLMLAWKRINPTDFHCDSCFIKTPALGISDYRLLSISIIMKNFRFWLLQFQKF